VSTWDPVQLRVHKYMGDLRHVKLATGLEDRESAELCSNRSRVCVTLQKLDDPWLSAERSGPLDAVRDRCPPNLRDGRA
jgi:hypothetical protein